MVDKFVNYSEDVATIQEAFTFIMDHLIRNPGVE